MRNIETTLCYRWFQEVWNQGNEQVIDELLAPDCKAHGIGTEGYLNTEGFKVFYHDFKAQFHDIHIEVLDVISQDDMECAHTAVTAVHTETGKEVKFSGLCQVRIENGKIAEAWNQFDFLGMHQQLGQVLTPMEKV
jgi:predicted ester cyclase